MLTAYMLWLWPFYPLYAMYLGRDMHCWLYTVTFGGFGLGWALDGLVIPLYVADHNEAAGYAERAQARHDSWFAWSTLFAPVRWFVLATVAVVSGIVVTNLVPPNSMLLPVVGPLYARAFGIDVDGQASGGSINPQHILALRLVVAVLGASLGLRLATPCVLTVRRSCRWCAPCTHYCSLHVPWLRPPPMAAASATYGCRRHMLGWGLVATALVLSSDNVQQDKLDLEGLAPQVPVVTGI